MANLSVEVIQNCKKKLLETKMDLINRVRETERRLKDLGEKSGDEGDLSNAMITEGEVLSNQERMRLQLREIDAALAKMDRGNYGICEETDELIEPERLLAIPWTRLSIEGAEVRESIKKRYAR